MKFFKTFLLLVFSVFLISSCEKEQIDSPSVPVVNACEKTAADNGWVFSENDKKWLYGGTDENWHFDITNWTLKGCQLKFGLGRENIKALITPEYVPLAEIQDLFYTGNERFIVVERENGIPKIYPITLMMTHEVVNDVIDGHPVMIAYCVLADLGAVYSRIYCGEELTFAVSGFTYHDPVVWGGLDAFVLWDRETESLWWPLTDQAISGKMNRTELKKYSGGWLDLTFDEIKQNYGIENVLVLKYNQTMDVPQNWPRLDDVDCQ